MLAAVDESIQRIQVLPYSGRGAGGCRKGSTVPLFLLSFSSNIQAALWQLLTSLGAPAPSDPNCQPCGAAAGMFQESNLPASSVSPGKQTCSKVWSKAGSHICKLHALVKDGCGRCWSSRSCPLCAMQLPILSNAGGAAQACSMC